MTKNVFKLWLKTFDMRMRGRKVVLLLDNCSAHITVEGLVEHNIGLRNTTLLYLPPNTTSKIQPCDAGIIRNFKAYYRRRFNRMLLDRIDRNIEAPNKINVLDAIQLAVASWELDVERDIIKNCFSYCKIRSDHLVDGPATDLDVNPPAEVIEELRGQSCSLHYNNPMDINFLLNHPDKEQVSYVPTEEEILARIANPVPLAEDDDDDDSFETQPVSVDDAAAILNQLHNFWLQQPNAGNDFSKVI